MRLRKRAGGLLLGAGVLFLIGTNVQAGMLFVLAALLLGAVVAGVLLPLAGLRGLRAELVAPEEATQGGETLVEVRLTNARRGLRWDVVVHDEHLEPASSFAGSIRPGERVELATIRRPPRRGPATTTAITVASAAPFGVAERRRRLPVDATTLVLPRIEPLGALGFVEPVATTEAGWHPTPRRGHGPDYLGVREYRPGDSMRHVHWGLTARHGQVMVREFEEERTRRLAIVVDTERDDAIDAGTTLDLACTVAASVMAAALAAGHGTRLAAAARDRSVATLRRTDEAAFLRWLALVEPSGVPLVETLAAVGGPELRGVETLVAAFPLAPDAGVHAVADALAGVPVVRVVAVPVGPVDGEALAALEAAGIDVRPWSGEGSLAAALGAEVVS
jgi:uncharacterized protein (DUF58 family)